MAEETEGSIEIEGSPAAVLAVITGFESYPLWATGVRTAEVSRRDARGRPVEVAFEVSQMGVTARYTLSYLYRARDGGLSWTTRSASGAVKDIRGEYVLEPAGSATRVTYRTAIELAIPMVGFLKRQGEKAIINTALGGLKRRVESLT